MKSMTGFGQASIFMDPTQIDVQLKTVNGRYLDIKAHLPRELLGIESQLHKKIRMQLHRGRIELWVEIRNQATRKPRVNFLQVNSYLQAVQELETTGIQGELTLGTLLNLPNVFDSNNKCMGDLELVTKIVGDSLNKALDQVLQHRETEGLALKKDLLVRISCLSSLTDQIEKCAEEIVNYYRKKLQEKFTKFQELNNIDPSRFAQEVALLADKADISEEITRLRSHISRFKEILNQGEPAVGKNLDFLCQELNREINTVLAKSRRVKISQTAITAKTEIEKIREQVQNVE